MTEFRSHRSYWDFAFAVRSEWRYVLPQEHRDFLDTVLATSEKRVELVPISSILFRAQVGFDLRPEDFGGGYVEDMECPFSQERMKPLRGRASEGRANPKGIPCLYVATHEETAVAESRPWVGALVSVAQLRTGRNLRLLNCTTEDRKTKLYRKEPDPAERERAVWRDIDRAFAEPVSRTDDDVASYAPTQMIAELFRQHGLDGIGYRSALGRGHNFALFDLDSADVINCSLVRVDRVTLEYSQAANPYYVTKYYPSLKAASGDREQSTQPSGPGSPRKMDGAVTGEPDEGDS